MPRTCIEGVRKGPEGYIVHVVVKDEVQIGEEKVEAALGEGMVPMPLDLDLEEMTNRITEVAEGIYTEYTKASNLADNLRAVEWPDPGARRVKETG